MATRRSARLRGDDPVEPPAAPADEEPPAPPRKKAKKAGAGTAAPPVIPDGAPVEPPRKKAGRKAKDGTAAPPVAPADEEPFAPLKRKAKARPAVPPAIPPPPAAPAPPATAGPAPPAAAAPVPPAVGAAAPAPPAQPARPIGIPDVKELTTAAKTAIEGAHMGWADLDAPTYPAETFYHQQPHHLGGGAMGQAHLWLAVDENQRIVDRKCVKDCWVDWVNWQNVHEWFGDLRDPLTRKHREIYIHEKLHSPLLGHGTEGREGGEFLARMFNATTEWRKMKYRLYLQFYPHGDLWHEVMQKYVERNEEEEQRVKRASAARKRKATLAKKKAKKGKKRKAPGADDTPPADEGGEEEAETATVHRLPEPFLWHTFECLIRAALVFSHGTTEAEAEEEDWTPIIHRDLKPHNIFLSAPNPENYPSYPIPVVADFGLAIATRETDIRNPIDFISNNGTDTYQAPEMLPMLNRTSYQLEPVGKLGSWTNIWCVGAVMVALMHGEELCRGTDIADFETGEGGAEPTFDEGVEAYYSDELRELVVRCTRYWPEDRIGGRELLEEILRHTTPPAPPRKGKAKVPAGRAAAPEDLARGLRAVEHDGEDEQLVLLWRETDEAYNGRLARQALEALGTEPIDNEGVNDGGEDDEDGDEDGDEDEDRDEDDEPEE